MEDALLRNGLETELRRLGITRKNAKPNHPDPPERRTLRSRAVVSAIVLTCLG
jgi:hypothetical protein